MRVYNLPLEIGNFLFKALLRNFIMSILELFVVTSIKAFIEKKAKLRCHWHIHISISVAQAQHIID
jgi:hypothetical protein